MITIAQIRAARALLDWSQADLAEYAGLSQTGIARIENGTNKPNSRTMEKIQTAFDHADIEFIGDTGVKKRTGEVKTLRGKEGFKTFIYDVYNTVKVVGGEICVSNVDEREFDKWQAENREDYLSKMNFLHNKNSLSFKILVKNGDQHKVAEYAEYRSLPDNLTGNVPFYVYGDKTAMIIFTGDDVSVHIIENKEIADAQRKQFNILWSTAKEKFDL